MARARGNMSASFPEFILRSAERKVFAIDTGSCAFRAPIDFFLLFERIALTARAILLADDRTLFDAFPTTDYRAVLPENIFTDLPPRKCAE